MYNVGNICQWLADNYYHFEFREDLARVTDQSQRFYLLIEPRTDAIGEKEYDNIRENVNKYGYEVKVGHNVVGKDRCHSNLFSVKVS